MRYYDCLSTMFFDLKWFRKRFAMKPGILIIGTGDSHWIGGLYYKKNVAFQLTQNIYISDKYKIFVLADRDNYAVFHDLPKNVKVKYIPFVFRKLEKYYKLLFSIFHRVKFVYPSTLEFPRTLGIQAISWIPDFQFKHLPNMYSKEDLVEKESSTREIYDNSNPLVLSSMDCKKDLMNYYGSEKKIYVMPFVSFISEDACNKILSRENDIMHNFGLEQYNYIYVGNQFWKHKNHVVVLEALMLIESFDSKVVLTGKLEDNRSPEYIQKIKCLLEKPHLRDKVINLGFLDRISQLVVLKNSKFIIQPSLFEGWGTVVEDAKFFNKTILLSDIPVHREQKNNKCILFDPNNPHELATFIDEELKKEHKATCEIGQNSLYARAKEYSKGMEQLIRDYEKV